MVDPFALPLILDHIQYVGSFTGLTLNLEKTLAFNHKCVGKHWVYGVQMSSSPVKYLGAYLGKGDLTKMNFEKPL